MERAIASCTVLVALGLFMGTSAHAQQQPTKGQDASVEGGGMPDLARGKLAAQAGHDVEAESNFLPLAKLGYVEAQLALARLYARRQTQQSTQEAIRWFRVAAQKEPLQAEVPLARLLLQQDGTSQLAEAQRLFTHAWDDRQDPEALAGLLELYAANPAYDTDRRMPSLVASAEKLDQPVTNGALISWYRNTRDVAGHNDRLLAMCKKSLNIAPTCYVDLMRDMRMRNDQKGMQQMVAAAMSQYSQGLIPVATAASLARALVAAPDGSLDAADPDTAVSDLPEADAEDLAQNSASLAPPPLPPTRTCLQDPVGVAKPPTTGNVAAMGAPAPPPVANVVPGKTAAIATPPVKTPATGAPNGGANPPTTAQPEANAQPDLANQILAKLVASSPEARVEAAGVAVRFPFLVPDFDVEPALKDGLKQGLPDATLYLGELYLHGNRAPRDPPKALELLQRAAKHPDTALDAQYYIGRLYQFGYLDEVDPQQATDHLLYAARRGYVSADSALARLYASGKGLCPDHVNAFVFAQLGARDGADAIRILAGQLNGVLTPQERKVAQQVLHQEETMRQQLPQTEPDVAEAASTTP
ncbi:MAG TPA: tetratricopeptide repeat protein [Dyella sp.]|uniref:tetratricopeptide repeat protein n=1 Tax=Dyella sp. TaxID=1869338 RepID=UPI002F92E958